MWGYFKVLPPMLLRMLYAYPKGRQKRYLLPASEVSRAKRGIAAYKKLWESLCRISEINLALLNRRPRA